MDKVQLDSHKGKIHRDKKCKREIRYAPYFFRGVFIPICNSPDDISCQKRRVHHIDFQASKGCHHQKQADKTKLHE